MGRAKRYQNSVLAFDRSLKFIRKGQKYGEVTEKVNAIINRKANAIFTKVLKVKNLERGRGRERKTESKL